MQVIEKVKVVPEGYNGAGMDGYGRRDVNGKANAGLTLGINAQYHDYCELFEKWFGSNFDEKIIASAVDFWFEDDDFDGNKVWKYFNEM